MKEETILQVLKSRGVFQINPLSYRDDKVKKVLKKLLKSGLLSRQVVSCNLHNYFLKG